MTELNEAYRDGCIIIIYEYNKLYIYNILLTLFFKVTPFLFYAWIMSLVRFLNGNPGCFFHFYSLLKIMVFYIRYILLLLLLLFFFFFFENHSFLSSCVLHKDTIIFEFNGRFTVNKIRDIAVYTVVSLNIFFYRSKINEKIEFLIITFIQWYYFTNA